LSIRKTIYGFLHRIKKRNIKEFFDQLAFMLSANLQMYNALVILRDSSVDKKIKYIARLVAESIRKGLPLHEALEKADCFKTSDIMQIKSGEESGSVPRALSRLATQYEREIEFANKIKSAMMYPVLIIVVMTAVLWVLLTLVVPSLSQTLISLGGELPAITKIVISVSNFLKDATVYILFVAAGLVWIYRELMKRDGFGREADRIKLKIPIAGAVLIKLEMSRFCRSLSIIQSSGIALVPSLKITNAAVKNRYLKNAVEKAARLVEVSGIHLSAALAKTRSFPAMMIQLIDVGVNAGKITDILDKIAEQYEREVDRNIKRITGLMEPVMIVIVGILVGIVVISMFLPLLSVVDTMM
jgi:type IV pilus assembly protein PilC